MPRLPPGRPPARAAAPLALALLALAHLAVPPPAGAAPGGPAPAAPTTPPGLVVLDEAEGAIDDHGQEPRVAVALVAERGHLYPDAPLRVGLRFRTDPGWHVYWKNPGGAAAPTVVTFHAEGLAVDALRWPAPSRFSEARGLVVTYGYEGEVLLAADARLVGAPAQVELGAEIDLLVCASECIPGRFDLGASLPVALGESAPEAPAPGAAAFEAWAARTPGPPGDDTRVEVVFDATAVRPGDRFRAAVGVVTCAGPPAPGQPCPVPTAPADGVAAAFIPERIDGVTVEAVGVRPHPTAYAGAVVDLVGTAGADDPRADQHLAGVLRLAGLARPLAVGAVLPRAPAGEAVASVAHPLLGRERAEAAATDGVVTAPAVGAQATAAPRLGLLQVLLFAFLGGLVLNLMPCVLPVLAIKAFSFAQVAHETRARAAAHVGAYTAGIVGSLLALAAVVVALRAAGTGLGWGFQLQEPRFVAAVAAVLVVFALNLFGVFEIGVGAGGLSARVDRAQGLARSVGEGVLAVVLATPCSAPFLGSAVGFAFASGPAVTFAVFAVLGLGLAAPFALLALVPGARRLVPRPGPWMDGVRTLLGFALLGTVVWLAWVLGRVTGVDGLARLLAFLLAVALATVVASGRGRRLVRLTAAAVVLLGAGAATWRFEAAPQAARPAAVAAAAADDPLDWAPFDAAAIEAALAAGHPVLVDFTADWCITCKVNETLVLRDARVVEAIGAGGVALFKADWTQRDEAIRLELARHGKAGVPLYLVYSPDRPESPDVLPELLTVDRVLDALRRAAPARASAVEPGRARAGATARLTAGRASAAPCRTTPSRPIPSRCRRRRGLRARRPRPYRRQP